MGELKRWTWITEY